MLEDKIEKSLGLIKKAENLSLVMQPDMGFYVGFSGGKDSQVVLELVKMAGVKYHAFHNVTTNDSADNVRFIKRHYNEVEFTVPKVSFFKLVERWGLPSIQRRWCCRLFKEKMGVGSVVLTGVRKEESYKRSKYKEIQRWSKKRNEGEIVNLAKMEDNKFQCVGGKDRFMIYPILEWTETDVWTFIYERGLHVNPCYRDYGRVGCVFCPFAKARDIRIYCETHPGLKAALLHSIERNMQERGGVKRLETAEEYFEWWLSRKSVDVFLAKKRQLSLDL